MNLERLAELQWKKASAEAGRASGTAHARKDVLSF